MPSACALITSSLHALLLLLPLLLTLSFANSVLFQGPAGHIGGLVLSCGGEHPFPLVFSSLSRPWWEHQILIEVGAVVVGCEKVRGLKSGITSFG